MGRKTRDNRYLVKKKEERAKFFFHERFIEFERFGLPYIPKLMTLLYDLKKRGTTSYFKPFIIGNTGRSIFNNAPYIATICWTQAGEMPNHWQLPIKKGPKLNNLISFLEEAINKFGFSYYEDIFWSKEGIRQKILEFVNDKQTCEWLNYNKFKNWILNAKFRLIERRNKQN